MTISKPKLGDSNSLEVTFREQLAADIFEEAVSDEISPFSDCDFKGLARKCVKAADALIEALEANQG